MPLIAVDGPAASGKGTIARALARHFGLPHLDTGALYRAVALATQRAGIAVSDAESCARAAATLSPELVEDPGIRSDETGQRASEIAAIPAVRDALLQLQREFAVRPGGAVLDGRDIGTVIAPEADAKLFVTADAAVRARRRHLELQQAGRNASAEDILQSILARDALDRGRTIAPLRKAADADLLDTSDLDIETSVQQAVNLVLNRLSQAD